MSLVNDMLRDLDQRQQKTPGQQSNSQYIAPSVAAGRSSGSRMWIGSIALLVVLLVVGYLSWPALSQRLQPLLANSAVDASDSVIPAVEAAKPAKQQAKVTAQAPLKQPDVAKEELPVSAALTGLAKIDKVTWQPAGDGYRLSIRTPTSLDYDIDQQSDNRLVLVLESVQFSSELPALPARFVQAAHIREQKPDLLLTLNTDQQVRFQIYQLRTAEGHSLNVELHPAVAKEPKGEILAARVQPAKQTVEPVMVAKSSRVVAGPEVIAAVEKPVERPTKPLIKTSKTLTPAQADRQMVRKASELVRKQRRQEAELSLQRYLQKQPEAMGSRRLLASLLLGEGQFKQASMLVEEGLKQQPGNSGLRKLKARILLNNGKSEQAVQVLQNSMPALQDDLEFHQLRAAALQQAGQHQLATQSYYQMLQLDSTQPSWWIGLGISLEALKQSSKAREAYRNVIKIPGVSAALREFSRQRIAQLAR